MRHCDDVLVFMIGMLLCVIIAIVVILLIASPSFREGERILTPVGEEKVQNVRRRAASVAARAEQETSRSAEAVKAVVRNRRRTEEDAPAEPTPDGNVQTAAAIPIDGDVVEERTVHLAKAEREQEPAPRRETAPAGASQPTQKVELKPAAAPAASQPTQKVELKPAAAPAASQPTQKVELKPSSTTPAAQPSTGSTPYRPVGAASNMRKQPVDNKVPDRLWVDEDDDLDDDVPEHFESPAKDNRAGIKQAEAVQDDTLDEEVAAPAFATIVKQDADDEEEPTDGGFFSRITSSLNRSSTDRSRTGPRHARA